MTHFDLESAPAIRNSYNITPASDIPVIRADKTLINCHWGLIPHWAKDTKYKPINARAETIIEKPFFRDSFKNRRCLIPANGFYEWKGPKGHKQPYYFKLKDSELLAFAGLWDHWDSPDKEIDSCTIITTGANEIMAPIHDRMPVIIDQENYDRWLLEGGEDLLMPYPGEMDRYPVSSLVNIPKYDDENLIAPIESRPS